jgi:hypothetical protein
MGNKQNTEKDATGKNSKLPPKAATKLTDADYKLLAKQTNMTKEEIDAFFFKFNKNNPDGKLDRAEFMKFYPLLRNEPFENLDEITDFVFNGKLLICSI